MAYATLAQLKPKLKIPMENTDYDDTVQLALDEATRLINDATHRRFDVSTEETRYIDCDADHVIGPLLSLPWDCHYISSVVNGDGRVIAITEFVPKPRLYTIGGSTMYVPSTPDAWPFYELKLKFSTGLVWTYTTSWESAIAITGKWGFSETPPEPIVGATLDLADHLYHLPDTAGQVIVSPDGVMLTPDSMPSHVKQRIGTYIKL